jgi:predicted Ser/Thr protein kinase
MEKHPPFLPMAQLQKDEELSARYELLQELAASNFTRVFKALSKQSGSVIALKIESILKSRAKMTLAHEFHVLGKLQGRTGVPKVYQFGEWSGGFFL